MTQLRTITAALGRLFVRVIRRPLAYAFGVDVFISYKRGEASQYAQNLADALERRVPGLACYIDRRSERSTHELPLTLKYQATLARMLVLVASENVREAKGVKEEIELFTRFGSRHSVVIDIDGTLAALDWRNTDPWRTIGGGDPETETREAFHRHFPSPGVFRRIRASVRYGVRARRQKNITAGLAILIAVSAAAVFFATRRATNAVKRAQAAVAAQESAEREKRLADEQRLAAACERDWETARGRVAAMDREQAEAEANAQWQRAEVARLATGSMTQLGRSNQLALLLAAASFDESNGAPPFETRSALLRALHLNPRVRRYFMAPPDERKDARRFRGEDFTAMAIQGDTIVTGDKSGTVRFFNRRTGRIRTASPRRTDPRRGYAEEALTADPSGLDAPVTAIAFSPSGRTMATAHGPEVTLWSMPDGKQRHRFRLSEEQDPLKTIVRALQFRSEDRLLSGYSVDKRGVVAEWEVHDPAKPVHEKDVTQLPASCTPQKPVPVCEEDTELPYGVLSRYSFAFDKSGEHVAIGYTDGHVVQSIWPPKPDEKPACRWDGTARVTALHYPGLLLTGDATGIVRRVNRNGAPEIVSRCGRAVWSIAGKDGKLAFVRGGVVESDGRVMPYSAPSQQIAWVDRESLVAANGDASVTENDATDRSSPLARHLKRLAAMRMSFTADDRALHIELAATRQLLHQLVDVKDGRVSDLPRADDESQRIWGRLEPRIRRHAGGDTVTDKLLTGDGRKAFVLFRNDGDQKNRLLQLDLHDSGEAVTDLGERLAGSLRSSFDGRCVMFSARNDRLVLMASGETHTLHLGDGAYHTALSPDCSLIAVAHQREIVLLDMATQALIGTLPLDRTAAQTGPQHRIQSFAFSRDGRTLAASDYSGIWLWNLDSQHWRELAVMIAGRTLTDGERRLHIRTR